jgi:hypothetical protein
MQWVLKDIFFKSRYNNITSTMARIFNTAKVPSFKDRNVSVSLDPQIETIFAKSRDLEELEYYWTQFRAATGQKMRSLFLEYLDLENEAARLNGFKDATEMKTEDFESGTFVEEMAETWSGLKPLYQELHAYVRNKLSNR